MPEGGGGGVHPDDPNVAGIKPDENVPTKDIGDGNKKVGLDKDKMPIVCASPCKGLDEVYGDVINGLEGKAKQDMLDKIKALDGLTGSDKVNKTQEIAAELNNIKNGKTVPSKGQFDVDPEGNVTQNENPKVVEQKLNVKELNDNYIKKQGFDAHAIKKEFLGNKAPIAKYDLFINKDTREILIFLKGGKGNPIQTGYFID